MVHCRPASQDVPERRCRGSRFDSCPILFVLWVRVPRLVRCTEDSLMIGFSIRLVCAVAMLLCVSCGSAFGQYEGIVLNPGEILISVNGVPVNQVCRNGQCGPVRSTVAAVASVPKAVASVPKAVVRAGAEVIKDARAYAFAKREADIQAARRDVGHFLGIAPGCSGAGVGSSGSTNTPNHCTFNDKALVARAFAIGRDGKVYWSAQYR